MEGTNGKDGSPQSQEERKNSEHEARVGSLGTIPVFSSEHGSYEIGTSRKDCNEGNTVVAGKHTPVEVGGKLIRQLVSETERQLAYHEEQIKYHEQQSELLKERIEGLKEIPENPTNTTT